MRQGQSTKGRVGKEGRGRDQRAGAARGPGDSSVGEAEFCFWVTGVDLCSSIVSMVEEPGPKSKVLVVYSLGLQTRQRPSRDKCCPGCAGHSPWGIWVLPSHCVKPPSQQAVADVAGIRTTEKGWALCLFQRSSSEALELPYVLQ